MTDVSGVSVVGHIKALTVHIQEANANYMQTKKHLEEMEYRLKKSKEWVSLLEDRYLREKGKK